MDTPRLSLEAVLSEMKERALEQRSLIVRLTLLFAFLSALIAVAGAGGPFAQAVSLGLSLLVGVTYTGMVVQALCVPGAPDSLGGLWGAVTPVLARLIWVSLAAAAGVAAGLLLFIVPGLILLTIWAVAQPVVVCERAGVFQSLGRSRSLVAGNGIRVFLFLLVLLLLALLASTFALLVAAPFGAGLVGAVVSAFLVTVAVNPLTAVGPAALYNCLTGGSLADLAQPVNDPGAGEPAPPDDPSRSDFTRTGGS